EQGGAWRVEAVAVQGDASWPIALALDRRNEPRILYGAFATGDLECAAAAAGTWSIRSLDAPVGARRLGSVAFDAESSPHASYCDGETRSLLYAGGFLAVPAFDSPAQRLAMAVPAPNPRVGRGATSFAFTLARGDEVRLDLYDVRGRLVARRSPELFKSPG